MPRLELACVAMKPALQICCYLFASLVTRSLACECGPATLALALQTSGDLVFRGSVLREAPSAVGVRSYIVQVVQVFKGYSMKPLDRVLVYTLDQAKLGIEILTLDSDYVISTFASQPIDAATRAQLGNRSKATRSVLMNSCGFNKRWVNLSAHDEEQIGRRFRSTHSTRSPA
jgi:hypothetical protein